LSYAKFLRIEMTPISIFDNRIPDSPYREQEGTD